MKQLSTVVLKNKKINDFARERNLALMQAREDWVLFIDSDEKVPPALAREIKKLKPSGYSGFYVKRKNYFLGEYVGSDKIIRLVKKGFGKWQRQVHEAYHLAGGTEAGFLKNCLMHNTAGNLYDYISKINNYSTLHALANKKEGKKATLFKIVFYPVLKFIQTYIKSGHMVFSLMQSFHSFLAWSKLWTTQSKKNYKQ